MAEVSFKDSVAVYSVTLPETAKFAPAAVKKAVGRFTLDRVELAIEGEASKDDKGMWLTAPSGTKLLLANRPKKDEKDAPPDVIAKIEEAIKAGMTAFAVSGEVKDGKEAVTVHLDSATALEKKKEAK